MGGIFQTDVLLKTILEEWLEGMKEKRQHGRKDYK